VLGGSVRCVRSGRGVGGIGGARRRCVQRPSASCRVLSRARFFGVRSVVSRRARAVGGGRGPGRSRGRRRRAWGVVSAGLAGRVPAGSLPPAARVGCRRFCWRRSASKQVADRCRRLGGGTSSRCGRGRPGSDRSRSPFFRLDVARVNDRPRPVNRSGSLQLREQQRVQSLPNAGLLPIAQPPPTRHPRPAPKLLRQPLPADTSAEHKQDPRQHPSVIEWPPTRIAKPARLPRNQRLEPHPQLVRHLPRLRRHRHASQIVTTGADDFATAEPVPSFL
jgi:hypothetical protein